MTRPGDIPDDEFSVACAGEDLVIEGWEVFEQEEVDAVGSYSTSICPGDVCAGTVDLEPAAIPQVPGRLYLAGGV